MQQSKKTSILQNCQRYLRQYPYPTSIDYLQGLFKLTYTYYVPYTDSKNIKQVFYAPEPLSSNGTFVNPNQKLVHNLEKGRLQEQNSFDSISTKDKHEQILQDDVFSKAELSLNRNRWIYIAEIKPKKPKGYFNEGTGKLPFRHDFGQTYDNVQEVGIFVWDKLQKKVFRIQISKNLIPSSPSFLNEEGTQIIFHAYQRQHFDYGLIYCLNRPIKIFKARLQQIIKPQEKSENKKQNEDKVQVKVETVQLFTTDTNRTKVFPKVSPCLKYLVYMSGSGNTHTFYKDFVICKKQDEQWIETHRIKNSIIGYHSILKNYILSQHGSPVAITQTLHKGCSSIIKVDLETGQLQNLTEHFLNHSFQIMSTCGSLVLGVVTTNNFNGFFYLKQGVVNVIPPQFKEDFVEKTYLDPIHSILVSAKEEDIWPQYRNRTKKRPLMVFLHGGPHNSYVNALTCQRYVLLKRGYYILYPNYSGSAGYGHEVLTASLGKIGEKDASQIVQTVKKVLSDHADIDRGNVHTQGGSFGGFLSAIFASRYPDIFKSAVISNGVLNIAANMWFADIPEWNAQEALGSPLLHQLALQDYQALYRQSPTNQTMKIPILQFLGAKDRRVPWRQGLLFDAITKANSVQITTYVYQNSGHSLSDSVQTIMDINIKTINFLESFVHGQQDKLEEAK